MHIDFTRNGSMLIVDSLYCVWWTMECGMYCIEYIVTYTSILSRIDMSLWNVEFIGHVKDIY